MDRRTLHRIYRSPLNRNDNYTSVYIWQLSHNVHPRIAETRGWGPGKLEFADGKSLQQLKRSDMAMMKRGLQPRAWRCSEEAAVGVGRALHSTGSGNTPLDFRSRSLPPTCGRAPPRIFHWSRGCIPAYLLPLSHLSRPQCGSARAVLRSSYSKRRMDQ